MTLLAEHCADDWPWEPSGHSLVRDIRIRWSARARSRSAASTNPRELASIFPRATIANKDLMIKPRLTIDPYQERGLVGVYGEVRKVIDTLLPQWLLEIPAEIPAWIKYL